MSEEVKRYGWSSGSPVGNITLSEHPHGGLVAFKDYQDLEAENAALRAEVEELKDEVCELKLRLLGRLLGRGVGDPEPTLQEKKRRQDNKGRD